MEFSLLAAALGVALAVYVVLYVEGRRGNAANCTRDVWDATLTAALGGLLVGRLAAMVLAGTNPLTHPADILAVRGGVDTVWASAGALGAFTWLGRRELAALADAAAGAALAGLAAWHAGCLVRAGGDACLGTPSGLPWALRPDDAPTGLARHPVELYAALLLIVAAAAVIAWRRRRRSPAGLLGAAALAAAAGARLATEPLRLTIGASQPGWYAVGTVAGIAAMAWAWRHARCSR